jgi:hypothetical protein
MTLTVFVDVDAVWMRAVLQIFRAICCLHLQGRLPTYPHHLGFEKEGTYFTETSATKVIFTSLQQPKNRINFNME